MSPAELNALAAIGREMRRKGSPDHITAANTIDSLIRELDMAHAYLEGACLLEKYRETRAKIIANRSKSK